MRMRLLCPPALAVLCCSALGSSVAARDLTFEDRVRCQEAIERVYYSHQIGATEPFEEAVPRAVLEKKVRTYLKQTVALGEYWKTVVTAVMLERETARIVRQTRMPERLQELFTALGNDAYLVHECLARATLVDRLTRNFHAYDERIQGEVRLEAEEVREGLLAGQIDPTAEHPRRTVTNFVLREEPAPEDGTRSRAWEGLEARVELAPTEFERLQQGLPEPVGQAGALVEERNSYIVRVPLEKEPGTLFVASFSVPKVPWDSWWEAVHVSLDEARARTVASPSASVPSAWGGGYAGQAGGSGYGAVSGASCVPDDTWNNGSLDDLPDPRYGHTAVWTGSEMIVWGGIASESNDNPLLIRGGPL